MKHDWSQVMDDPAQFAAEDAAWFAGDRSAWFRTLLPYFPPTAQTVLDVGCAAGYGLRVWLGAGYRVTGIDASQNCLNTAKLRAPEALVTYGDIRHASLRSADVVVCTALLKHFAPEVIPDLIGELCRAATQGVVFTMQVADAAKDDGGPTWWHSYLPLDAIIAAVEAAGWRVAETVTPESGPEHIFVCRPVLAAEAA